ncbi:hypothetical protein BYT27DRAFT_7101950 [Phlegmacium glaucopus]|nr:hypothetical protein BYT27DRAFT_7101950 [Phlegmacium glaucopus]
MSLPSPLDDVEGGIVSQERFSVSIHLPILYSTPSTRATDFASSVPILNIQHVPQLEKPLPPLPPPSRPVSKLLINVELPPPRKRLEHRPSRWIRFWLWFNTYRKFFTFVMIFNLIGLFLTISGTWTYPRRYTSALVLGNFLMAILVRNELFGRFLYLFVNIFFAKWPPLKFRLACTSVLQHLGGIHSGCATSGFLWLLFKVIVILKEHRMNLISTLVMGVLTNIVVGVSIISAFPWIRNAHHNVFERCHRFMGWLGLVFTWIFVVLGHGYDLETHSWIRDRSHIVRQQDFWFAFGMTIFVILPWFTVREVKVDIEIPSPKVAIIRFERGMQQGLLARIGRSSIMEYHAFGIISEGEDAKEHYLICGVQGDFTKSLVKDPPTHLWTREVKFAGVSNSSTLYKRGIRVCTGTGLGASLSTCLQESFSYRNPDWYLIWIGSDQEKTFGPTISSLIRRNLGPERMTLWDSKKRGGRPDVMKLIKEAYHSWGAEVVFITSNLQGNREMMEGCKRDGIPAFGTLWDF